jgi:hypothetical protein
MSLHPDIQRLLGAFERRRRWMLVLRGTLCAGSALLLGTLLAVLIDAPLVLDDNPRLVLAGLVYVGVVAVFWWRALRRFKAGSQTNVAAWMEGVAPDLRGSFLAAVELAPSADDTDSTLFRRALQEQTAGRIRGISVSTLLPLKRLKRDLLLWGVAMAAIGVGFALKGSRFGWQCARALLPLANFERLSDTQITVVQPSPVEGIVPADEPLQVEISVVSPGEVEPLVLARQANGSKLRIPMRAAGPGRFEASLPVEREPLVYQVRAGYSLTRRLRLEPRTRPRVTSFAITYHYPGYTGLPDRKVTAETGAVSALEGTSVEIVCTPDQAVSSGSVALTLGPASRELLLEKVGSEGIAAGMRTRFEVTEGGAYTVRMASTETGLRSAAGPQHLVQVELDTPPQLTLEIPLQDVLLPLGDQVTLEGKAVDDFGLAGVEMECRQNEAGWQKHNLAAAVGKQFEIRTAFDSLAQKARPGDVWSLRFAAMDARGQRGESRIVRISIAPPGTVARPNRALAAQKSLFQKVKELAGESTDATAALEKLKTQTERGAPDDLKASEALVRAGQSLEKAVQAAESARAAIRDMLDDAAETSPLEEAVLRREARVLGAAQMGDLQAAVQALQQLRPLAENKAASVEAARFAHEAAAAGASLARLVEESVRTRLDVMEAASLVPAARALSAEIAANQNDVPPDSEAPVPAPREDDRLRRHQVNQTLSGQLQGQLQKLAERAQPAAAALRPVLEELRRSHAAAEKAVQAAVAAEDGQLAAPLAAAGEAQAKSLERSAHSLDTAKPALKVAAERAQNALGRADRTGSETLERSAREIGALAHKQNLPAGLRDAEAAIRAAAAADVLRADAEAESVGGEGSPKLARALLLAAAALEAPSEGASAVAAFGAQASEVAKAFKPVEAAAATEMARNKADALAARIDRQQGPASPTQMAERKQLKEAVQSLPKQIREARLPEVAATAAREAGDALGGDATAGLAKATEALKAGTAAVAEMADKALSDLAKKAPSLAQQMERLAAKASKDSETTAALAKKTPAGAEQQTDQRELAGALRAESEFERKLDQLRQALRAEANAQDVRTASGRESARDADGASAQLKDAGARAQAALQQAAKRVAERQPLLEKASAFQKQGAEQLRLLAENFQKLGSAEPAERAAARKALREADKTAVDGMKLDARQERIAELAKLAELVKESPEAALAKAGAMEASGPQGVGDPAQGSDGAQPAADAPRDAAGKSEAPEQSAKSNGASGERQNSPAGSMAQAAKAEVSGARAALQEGGENSAERAAQMLAAAVDAQAAADRGERMQDGVAPATGANSNAGLGGMVEAGLQGLPADKRYGTNEWGDLPKRLATDMLEGRRESAPSEYREAVEAYFRAVAERARGGAGR